MHLLFLVEFCNFALFLTLVTSMLLKITYKLYFLYKLIYNYTCTYCPLHVNVHVHMNVQEVIESTQDVESVRTGSWYGERENNGVKGKRMRTER